MKVTICDERTNSLMQFEQKYCFSPESQPIYTADGIRNFLESASDEKLYELREPLDTVILALKGERFWILLGPYVENAWNQKYSRTLLAGLHIPEEIILPYKEYRCQIPIVQRENAIRLALLLAENQKKVIKNRNDQDKSGETGWLIGVFRCVYQCFYSKLPLPIRRADSGGD